MNKIFNILFIIILTLFIYSCGVKTESADTIQRNQTEKALSGAQQEIGMPNILNFQQRKLMKMIYEQTDRANLICYVYLFSELKGELIFVGKCIGYGVPFSAQFTNPEKVVQGDHELGYDLNGYVNFPMKLPQADPNGLFMPVSSDATWLLMFNEKTGESAPVYFEPKIIVSPFPLI